jgi:membrane-associated protease RseP (regulator of RpoE activity)
LSLSDKELEFSKMDAENLNPLPPPSAFEPREVSLVDLIPEFDVDYLPPPPVRHLWRHMLLFLATCTTTFIAGVVYSDHCPDGAWAAFLRELSWPAIKDGLMYSAALMTILFCHEMGHFVQACRYGVYASLPYFIPCPLPPIGTFGAVIRMDPQCGNRKAIFDIGISGPLAGLLPTFALLLVGLSWSHCEKIKTGVIVYGTPLLVKHLFAWMHGPIPAGSMIAYHPIAFAAWVGLLITSINLMPIGQLDGGHILYGMFRKKAHVASMAVLVLAITASIAWKMPHWWFMLGVITFLGTRHPPTTDDSVSLGAGRYVLGMLTLAFLFLGFAPVPFRIAP